MFPGAGPARWTALRRQAEGDGIMDAAVLARYETFCARGAPLAGVARGPEAEVPPRPGRARGRGRRLRTPSTSARSPSAARSAIWISATATRAGGRPGRSSPPGSSGSASARRWPGPRRPRSGELSTAGPAMTWIATIPYEAAEGQLRELYDRIKAPGDHVDNLMRAQSLRPHSLAATWRSTSACWSTPATRSTGRCWRRSGSGSACWTAAATASSVTSPA